MDWLPEHPPNFMKRMREPFERKSKKKTLKIEDSSSSQKLPAPLDFSTPSKSSISEAPLLLGSRQIPSSLPQTTPTYSHSEPTILVSTPSETQTSASIVSDSLPIQPQFNLNSTSLPISKAMLLNKPISPPSSTPSSPSYYDLSYDFEQPEVPNPSSPTLAQLQATTNSEQTSSIPETSEPTPSLSAPPSAPLVTLPSSEPPIEPSKTTQISFEPINPTYEPEPTFSTLEEVFAIFSGSSAARLKQLFEESIISDNPYEVRTH